MSTTVTDYHYTVSESSRKRSVEHDLTIVVPQKEIARIIERLAAQLNNPNALIRFHRGDMTKGKGFTIL